jgi:hypothetical protein
LTAARPEPPAWVAPLDMLLREAIRRVPLLSFATPTNFDAQVARLEEAARRGDLLEPDFTYRRIPDGVPDLAAAIGVAVSGLPDDPLGRIYARRALQVCGDLHWARDLEGGTTSGAGAQRYPRRDVFDEQADALALDWLDDAVTAAGVRAPRDEDPGSGPYRTRERTPMTYERFEELFDQEHGGTIVSDDEADPRSLVSRMRAEIGARRLPARVIVVSGIAPLAAAGDGVVQVAAGRRVSAEDVERTVAHEIEGHLLPAFAARTKAVGIFALGTTHGSDDQEGRAIWIEARLGHLSGLRKRTLALRHLAARGAHAGVEFVPLVESLRERGAFPRESIRLAARALRGGGLGREAVYMPGLLRVEAALARDPTIDDVLASGRVGVDDADALRPWIR